MKKLIITIGCALAAHAQADDDNIYSQMRQSSQTYQITQAIEDQGREIVKALESQSVQPRYSPSISPAQIEAEDRKLDEARTARATAIAKTLPPLVLPSNGLEEYEKAKAALPAGYVMDKPNADGTITASKLTN